MIIQNQKKSKEPTDWKAVGDIMKLACLAEINFLICQKIYNTILSNTLKNWPAGVNKEIGQEFFLLSANNAFFESVGILHTLICSIKKEEVRIKPLLEKVITRDKDCTGTTKQDVIEKFYEHVKNDYPNQNYLQYTFLLKDEDRLIGDVMADIRRQKRIKSGLTDLEAIKNKFEKYDFHKIRHQTAAHKNKLLEAPAGASTLYLKDGLTTQLGEIIKDLRINLSCWFDYALENPYSNTIDSFDEILRVIHPIKN